MKYKVGDKVRIRKDLKFGSGYGDRYVTAYMEKFSNKVVTIKYVGEDYYGIEEDDYCDWTDEMIEGLWEENKPKYKLIDILNKIANGELKEGTKFVYRGNMYIWEDNMILNTTNTDVFDIADRSDLNMELELIEPDHFTDVGKMAEHIRNDTKMIEPTDNTKIEELSAWGRATFEYGSPVPADWVMANKLNEVIRYINK